MEILSGNKISKQLENINLAALILSMKFTFHTGYQSEDGRLPTNNYVVDT